MKILVGLGNPGHTFDGTRHNVGFAVIQLLAKRRGIEIGCRVLSAADGRPAAVYGEYTLGTETVRLLMPLTMMNESGEALRGLPVPLDRVCIICDDVNLPLGVIRVRPDGGPGGHHGLQSCLGVLGTETVPRLRIGVGGEEVPKDLTNFVLSQFRSPERPVVKHAIEQAADACETWVQEGVEVTMNRFNRTQDTTS